MPRPPCERSSERVDLREQVEDRRQHRRARCRRRRRARARRTRSPSRVAPTARCVPPAGGVLGGVVEQVAEHLLEPRGIGVDRDRPVAAASPCSACRCRVDHTARPLSTRVRERSRAGRRGSRRSCILPRVMRETSSRSSTRRARCVDLALDDLARRAAASARRCRRGAKISLRVADRRERVAQLVGEHREELVLAPVGLAARSRAAGVAHLVLALARAQRRAHRGDDSVGHAHRPLEQGHVAERLHRRRGARAESGAAAREHDERQVRPRRLLAQVARRGATMRWRGERLLGHHDRAGAGLELGAQRRRCRAQTNAGEPAPRRGSAPCSPRRGPSGPGPGPARSSVAHAHPRSRRPAAARRCRRGTSARR